MSKKHALSTAFFGVVLSAALVAPMAYGAPADSEADAASLASGAELASVSRAEAVSGVETTGSSVQAVSFDDHRVATVNPAGTTINLFDYWHSVAPGDNTPDNTVVSLDDGINKNHAFKFSGDQSSYPVGHFNRWTRSSAPKDDIVAPLLGFDGFPVLNEGVTGTSESLAYLFDKSEGADQGKRAYSDVEGLLQIDENGYYYYQSSDSDAQKGNFASFDEETNSFSVYDKPAVNHHGNDPGQFGMFFPFNSAEQVFDEVDGELVAKPLSELDYSNMNDYGINPVNHFFGLNMITRFVQTENGMTEHGNPDMRKPLTYEFEGDDDVWVFIDDVLVGDLGGIHDAAKLKIDFNTGEVFVNDKLDGTLRQKYDEAGRADKLRWDEDNPQTYAEGTTHTLRFFYLERGGYASNMHLKFNLVSIPDSGLVKVDQYGRTVPGAEFALYAADENYNKLDSATPISKGTTDEDGNLLLRDANDSVVSFEEWHMRGIDNFVLEETKRPGAEYRIKKPLHLRHVESESKVSTGFVVSDNTYDTGSVASPKVLVKTCAPEEIVSVDGINLPIAKETGTLERGIIFAAPMRLTGDDPRNTDDWQGVYGSTLDGWRLSEATSQAGAIEAAKKQKERGISYEFVQNQSALYEVTLPELPGYIETYYSLLPEADRVDEAEYAVAYFWTEADSLEGAEVGNTHQLLTEDFTRIFAAQLYIPNVYSRIAVQKVDQNGVPVNGAEFGLFAAEDGTESADDPDSYRIKEGAIPIATVETGELVRDIDGIDLQGAAVFNGRMEDVNGVERAVLEVGKSYFIAETAAPEGYEINPHATRVFVSDEGVFADAGVEDDGVKVRRDVGMLLDTMKQYAENPAIDATLHDIKVQLYTTSTDPEKVPDIDLAGWAPQGDVLHLNYDSANKFENAVVDYRPQDGAASPLQETDVDWSRTYITQCIDEGHGDGNKEELPVNQDLGRLYSGVAIVQVTDNALNDLIVSKEVAGYEGMDEAELAEMQKAESFAYEATFTVPEDEYVAESARVPLADGYSLAIQDAEGNPVFDEGGAALAYPIVEGKVSFELKHGQRAVVEDLPASVRYEVEEAVAEGFTASTELKGDGRASGAKASGALSDADTTDQGITPVEIAYTNVCDKPGEPEDPTDPGDPDDPDTPTDPDDPDTPTDPGDPGDPDNPGTPSDPGSNGGSSVQGGSYAQTNDGSLVLMAGVAVMAVAAIGLLVVALIMRKRQ